MIIQCENCKRKFKVDASRIKPEGSKVRCSKCGHIFMATKDMSDGAPEDIDIKKESFHDASGEEGINSEHSEEPLGHHKEEPSDEVLDIELEKAPKDGGNWEDFVNITKSSTRDSKPDSTDEATEEQAQGDFSWGKLSLDDEPDEPEPDIPEMFEEDEPADAAAPNDEEPQDKNADSEPPERPRERERLTLDTDTPDTHQDFEGYYGKASQETIHRGVYRSTKPKRNIVAKIFSALMIAAVFVIIIVASFTILINLNLIPEDQVIRAKSIVESVLPVNLTPEQTEVLVITQHGGSWVSTRYGPLYVVSGLIKNVSGSPVHYILLRSEFISAGKTLYEDTVYAGNTFTENELKLSRTEDIVFKLKKKNGDIDYYNMDKLTGRNYNIKPGETIPFFAVFPSDRTVLGLKYNLEVIDYEGTRVN